MASSATKSLASRPPSPERISMMRFIIVLSKRLYSEHYGRCPVLYGTNIGQRTGGIRFERLGAADASWYGSNNSVSCGQNVM
jgi:hypothetical protein